MKNVLALIPQEIQFHMGQQQWHFSSFLGTVCGRQDHIYKHKNHIADKIMAISFHFLIGWHKTSYLECNEMSN